MLGPKAWYEGGKEVPYASAVRVPPPDGSWAPGKLEVGGDAIGVAGKLVGAIANIVAETASNVGIAPPV